MHRAILRAIHRHLGWQLSRFLIRAVVNAMHQGRHFFFFNHFYVYLIDGVPPDNILFVCNSFLCASAFLFARLDSEPFWLGVDRARLWPWLLDLALFVRF